CLAITSAHGSAMYLWTSEPEPPASDAACSPSALAADRSFKPSGGVSLKIIDRFWSRRVCHRNNCAPSPSRDLNFWGTIFILRCSEFGVSANVSSYGWYVTRIFGRETSEGRAV